MTDWKALAAAAEPPVPEELLDQVIPPLVALEAAFRPLLRDVPPDALAWDGPTVVEKAGDAE
jgi:hypothetical protein